MAPIKIPGRKSILPLTLAALIGATNLLPAQVTAFTYQGRLDENGVPTEGVFDFRFTVYNAASAGAKIGSTVNAASVPVSNGLFTVALEFGTNIFDGRACWLDTSLRRTNAVSFTALSPRQPLTPAPYAIYANSAGTASGLKGSVTVQGTVTAHGFVGNGTVLTTGQMEINAPDGQRNVVLGALPGHSGNGSVSVHGTNGTEKASMVVDAAGKGKLTCDYIQINGGADIAEPFEVRSDRAIQPGMVVAINPERPGELRLSDRAYDPTVAGIISGANDIQPGLTLQQEGTLATGRHPVALTGRVWCHCDATVGGAITPGDLLTSAEEPGHAMKAGDRNRAFGAIIGKAMTPLPKGKGLVLVLVSLQ